MKPAEQFEQYIRDLQLDIKTDTEKDNKVLNEMFSAFDQNAQQSPANNSAVLWRIILKNRIVQISTAAIVLIAVMIGLHKNGGSIDGATVALADVMTTLDKQNWGKVVINEYLPGEKKASTTATCWYNRAKKQILSVENGKSIESIDFIAKQSKVYIYETNELTINPENNIRRWEEELFNRIFEIKTVDQLSTAYNRPPIQGNFQGKKALIFSQTADLDDAQNDSKQNASKKADSKIVDSKTGESKPRKSRDFIVAGKVVKYIEGRLYVDIETKLPLMTETKFFDANKKLIQTKTSETIFPDSGPADIYDLGVPRKGVKIINNVPSAKALEVQKLAKRYREAFTKTFITVEADSYLLNGIERDNLVRVTYHTNEARRFEWYNNTQGAENKLLTNNSGLKYSADLIKKATGRKNPLYLTNLDLYKEDGDCRIYVSSTGELRVNKSERERRNWDHFRVYELGWPWRIDNTSYKRLEIIEDDYSLKHDLIRLEMIGGGIDKDIFYLNPRKDYLCQRHIEQCAYLNPWLKHEGWVDEKTKAWIGHNSIIEEKITDIEEYGQTKQGQWYKKVVETLKIYTHYTKDGEVYNRYGDSYKCHQRQIRRIYLIEDPEFPEGIFDPASLPTIDNDKKRKRGHKSQK